MTLGNALKQIWRVATTLLGLLAAAPLRREEDEEDGRSLHDSDLAGEYNYRTQRLDAGTDPYGWYENGDSPRS